MKNYQTHKNYFLKFLVYALFLLTLSTLTGCSSSADLKSPCPYYGRFCTQKPINT